MKNIFWVLKKESIITVSSSCSTWKWNRDFGSMYSGPQTKFQFWFSNSSPVSSQLVLTNPDLSDRPIRITEPQSGPIYYTRFWSCTPLLRPLPATARWTNLVRNNQFPELNWHIFHPLAINFTVWSHILSTVGNAVRSHPRGQGSSLHTEGIMYY
jgi:hypothetical protein